MNDRLGVRICIELVPLIIEFFAKLSVIVDLSVKDDPLSLIGVADRLFTAREVDDGKRRIAKPTFSRT